MSYEINPYNEFRQSTYQQILKKKRPKKFKEYLQGRRDGLIGGTCLDYNPINCEKVAKNLKKQERKNKKHIKSWKIAHKDYIKSYNQKYRDEAKKKLEPFEEVC